MFSERSQETHRLAVGLDSASPVCFCFPWWDVYHPALCSRLDREPLGPLVDSWVRVAFITRPHVANSQKRLLIPCQQGFQSVNSINPSHAYLILGQHISLKVYLTYFLGLASLFSFWCLLCRWPDGRPTDGHLIHNDWLHVPRLHRPHF